MRIKSSSRDAMILICQNGKVITKLSRGICDNISGENSTETGKQKIRFLIINSNNVLTFNKLPDWLRGKIKIMREIKRDSGRDDRIQRKCTYSSLLIVCCFGRRFFLGNSFGYRLCTLSKFLNRISIIRPRPRTGNHE